MARIDYAKHQSAFSKQLKKNPKLTLAEYCESEGLVYSTARKHIKKKAGQSQTRIDAAKDRAKENGKKQPAHDWHAHLKNYLTRATQNPSFSMKAYAEEQGLNAATVRRQFKGMRDHPEFDHLFDLFEQQKAELSVARSSKNEKRSGKPTPSWAGRKEHAIAKRDDARTNRGNKWDQKPEQIGTNEIGDPYLKHTDVSAPVLNRAYMLKAGLEGELLTILSEVDPLSVSNELLLARGNYLKMQENLSNRVNELVKKQENGEVIEDDDGNETDLQAAIDRLMYGYAPRLRELEMSITQFAKAEHKRYIDLRKLTLDELQSPAMLPAEEANIVIAGLELRIKNNWSALETCQHLERLGARPPATLMHEMRMELENMEPEVEEGGVTEEELDAMFNDYEERQQIESGEWLDERREEVAQKIQEAEDIENGIEPDLSPSDIIKEAATHQAYDDLDEVVAGFDDIDSFEVLGGETG